MAEKEVVSTRWLDNMSFESEINGHKIIIDAKPEFGGEDKGPRPAEDMAYTIDLSDVIGDKVYLRLEPPAGYWLIDHLALDFSKNVTIETAEIAPEDVDGPEAADALAALAAEDATTYVLYPGEPACALTFRLPPPKEGMKRSLFLRTVSCYETAPPNIHNR